LHTDIARLITGVIIGNVGIKSRVTKISHHSKTIARLLAEEVRQDAASSQRHRLHSTIPASCHRLLLQVRGTRLRAGGVREAEGGGGGRAGGGVRHSGRTVQHAVRRLGLHFFPRYDVQVCQRVSFAFAMLGEVRTRNLA